MSIIKQEIINAYEGGASIDNIAEGFEIPYEEVIYHLDTLYKGEDYRLKEVTITVPYNDRSGDLEKWMIKEIKKGNYEVQSVDVCAKCKVKLDYGICNCS